MGFFDSLFGEEKKVEKKVQETERKVETKADSTPTETKKAAREGAKLLGKIARTPGHFCFVTKDGEVYETAPKRKVKK